MEERREPETNFLKCPFCSCVFVTKADLEKHLAAFGRSQEQHRDAQRRIHGRAEYESDE